MIVDKINKFLTDGGTTINEYVCKNVGRLAEYAFKRQFMDEHESSPNVRFSSAGKCPRQLAYKLHGFELKGKEVDSRGKMTFFYGDMIELVVIQLAKLAGCGLLATGTEQMVVRKTICGVELVGHPDGILFNDGKFYLVECKSMSDFSYKSFDKGEVDPAYVAQMNFYMDALGLDECVLVAQNKNSNVLGELVIKKDPYIVTSVTKNIEVVLRSTKESLPDPAFDKNDKGFYPWNCLYCAYWGHCRPRAERVLVGGSYKLKEAKDAVQVESTG